MIHSNPPTIPKKREKFFVDREQVDSIRYNLVRDAGNYDSVASLSPCTKKSIANDVVRPARPVVRSSSKPVSSRERAGDRSPGGRP